MISVNITEQRTFRVNRTQVKAQLTTMLKSRDKSKVHKGSKCVM